MRSKNGKEDRTVMVVEEEDEEEEEDGEAEEEEALECQISEEATEEE